jgi:preprotein translocase subunit SecG
LAAAFQIVQVIMAITIIVLILLQVKGSGLGSIFGGDGGVYRTRRGVEKTMFQATVGLSIFFFVVSLVAVVMAS